MAKVIVRDFSDLKFATVKAFFDEVAEECSLLQVSNTDNTLIWTIDTDLVVSAVITSASAFGERRVVFNDNVLANATSGGTYNSGTIVVAYTETFFLFHIKYGTGVSNNILFVNYEKIANEKFAYGVVSSNAPTFNLYDMSKVSVSRYGYSSYTSPTGYIDYTDNTVLVRNGVRLSVFDTNFLYTPSNLNIYGNIITVNNCDYYAVTNNFLIPIDTEEE